MRGRLAAVAAAVVALLVGPSGVAQADSQSGVLEPGTVQVQLSLPAGYVAPSSSPEPDLSGVEAQLYGGASSLEATSDDDGVLTFTGVPTGDFSLWVDSPGGSDLLAGLWADGRIEAVDDAGMVTVGTQGVSLQAQYQRGGLLRGTVLDPDGAPVADARVYPLSGRDDTRSAADGSFSIALPPGDHSFYIEAPETGDLVGGTWLSDDQSVGESDRGIVTVGGDLSVSPASITARLVVGAAVEGTVLDADGEAASDVTVYVAGRQSVTDAQGRYRIGGIAPGEHEVEVRPTALYQVGGYIATNGGVSQDWQQARSIVVSGAETVTGVDARLGVGGAITGHVSGLPDGIEVSVNAFMEVEGHTVSAYATSEGGDFTLSGVAPGTWEVTFSTWGGSGAEELVVAQATATVQERTTTTIAAEAVTGGSISGRVTDSTGAAVSEGYAYASGPGSGGATIAGDGAFRVPGLVAGAYELGISTNVGDKSVPDVQVELGENTDVGTIQMDPLASVAVTVTGSDALPVSGAVVWLSPYESGTGYSGTTDEQGRVDITAAAGSYQYWIDAEGYQDTIGSIDLVGGETFALEVTLERAQSFTVTLTDGGVPVAGREVEVTTEDGDLSYSFTTDDDGRIRVQAPDGDYRLRVPTITGDSSWNTWEGSPSSEVFHGSDGAEITVDLPVGLRIGATVLDITGAPVVGTWVEIALPSGESLWTWTDSAGRVIFDGLVPGSYLLSTSIDGEVFYFDGASEEVDATPVTVSAEARSADVTLGPVGGSRVLVTGTVLTPEGEPAAGERMYVVVRGDDEWREGSRSVTTGPDGVYRASLPRGTSFEVQAATGPESVYAPSTVTGEIDSDALQVTADVELVVGRVLTGTVLGGTAEDPSGQSESVPVQEARISYWSRYFDRSVETGPDGSYILRGLPWDEEMDGSLYVWADYHFPTYIDADDGATTVLEVGGKVYAGLKLLDLGDDDSGHSGNVRLTSADGGSSTWFSIWGTGDPEPYGLGLVHAGTYAAQFSADGWVTQYYDNATSAGDATPVIVAPGEDTHLGIVSLSRITSLSGTVTAGEVPLGQAEIVVSRDGEPIAQTTADIQGRYALTGLPDGELDVEVRWQGQPAGSTQVTLVSNEARSLDLAADTSVVQSVVRVAITGALDDDAFFQGRVRAFSPSFELLSTSGSSDGIAQFVNLASTTVGFLLEGDSRYLRGALTSDGRVVEADGFSEFEIVPGVTYTELSARVERPAVVSGTVTDAEGVPLQDMLIQASGGRSAWTDAQGHYELSELRPGDITVTAGDGDSQFQNATVAVVGLEEAERRTTDFALTRYGTLWVSVTDVDGNPVEGARLQAFADRGAVSFEEATDADGMATFVGLRDVDYRFRIFGPDAVYVSGYLGGRSWEDATLFHVSPGQAQSTGHTLLKVATLTVDLDVEEESTQGETLSVDLLDPVTREVLVSQSGLSTEDGAVVFPQTQPHAYLVRVSGGYYATTYLTGGGQTADIESAEPVVLRGDGVAVTRSVTVTRPWTESVTTITTAPSEVTYGSEPVITATVTVAEPGRATELPVELLVDGNLVVTEYADGAGGKVSLSLPMLRAGAHSVEVRTLQSGAVRGSSDTWSFEVRKSTPVFSLSVPSAVTYGDGVDLWVYSYLDSGAFMEGTVDLTIGGQHHEVAITESWGRLHLDGGTLAVGTHRVTATLRGTDNTEAVDAEPVELRVDPVPVGLTATAVAQTVPYSGTVSVTTTLDTGTHEPSGTLTLLDGERELAQVDASREATLSVPAAELGAGAHALTVRYSGSGILATAESHLEVIVEGEPTTVLVLPMLPVSYGDDVQVQIFVTTESGTEPSGEVLVHVGDRQIWAALSSGSASVTVPAPGNVGSYAVWAEYPGSGPMGASTSEQAQLQVRSAEAVVALVDPGQGTFGTATTLRATVATRSGVPAEGTVRALVDSTEVASATLSGGGAHLSLPATILAGDHTVEVHYDGSDNVQTGTSPVLDWRVRSGPPVVDVALSNSLLPLPAGGTAELGLTVTATAASDGPMTYRVWFGDGTPVETGTYTQPLTLSHLYSRAGRHLVRVEVEASDAYGTYVGAYGARVTVYADEALTAVAGDPQRVVAGDSVWFDASASRPAAAIDRVEWDFGDGTTGSGWQVSHTYAEAGEYTATLTVGKGGESATATTTVGVAEPVVVEGVTVTVRSGGALVSGATATYLSDEGTRVQAQTGVDGTAVLRGLPDGEVPVYVTAAGYLPVAGSVTVLDGSGSLEVELASGEVAASTLDHRTLTYDEIVERGIDVEDPENANVFLAEIHLAIVGHDTPEDVPNVEIVYQGTDIVDVRYYGEWSGDSGAGGDWTSVHAGYSYTPTIVQVGDTQAVQWMVIPVKGSWLKEFFEVRMVVQNLAPQAFTFTQGQAELTLPEGLSLAPTATAQSLSTDVADVPGGGSVATYWTLRGDTEGEYQLSARYTGVLDPVGDPIDVTAVADRPLKVWGGSAVKWQVQADPETNALDPFRLTVTLTNQTPTDRGVPVYRPSFQVLQGQGYLLSPDTEYTKTVPVLYPGESVQFEFVYHSLMSGWVNVDNPNWAQSFIVPTGGNVEPDVDPITVHADRTEHLDIATAWVDMPDNAGYEAGSQGLAIAWETVAGVEDYSLWGRDSLEEGEWTLVTDGVQDGVQDLRVIPEDSDQVFEYYTVISRFPDGTTKPAHRIETLPDKPVPLDIDSRDVIDISDRSSLTLGGNCYDVLTLGVAGSGEKGTIGKPVGVISDALAGDLVSSEGDAYRSHRSAYLFYPAEAVPIVGDINVSFEEYIGSIDEGISQLTTFLESRIDQCPNEKLVLAGYSQGALVISQVLSDYRENGRAGEVVPASRFAGIYLIANPANYSGNGGERWGTAATSMGVTLGGSHKDLFAPRHVIPEDLQDITVSLCDADDIVCAIGDTVDEAGVRLILGQGWKAAGLALVDLVRGYYVHTTYDTVRASTLSEMAGLAAHRLLGMAVPTDSVAQLSTLADVNFESEVASLKYLRPDVEAQWSQPWGCAPATVSATQSGRSEVRAENFALTLSGTAPAQYYDNCRISVVGDSERYRRTIPIELRSGWAAIAAAAVPVATVAPGYELRPLGTQVLDKDGNPVPGAEVVFRLTGPATFPDGTREQRVTTDSQGYARSTTPLPVAGGGGAVAASAEVPGVTTIDLPSQEVQSGLPDGVEATLTPTLVDGRIVLRVTIVNTTDNPGLVELESDFGEEQGVLTAHGSRTIDLPTSATALDAGGVLLRVHFEDTSGGIWLPYAALDVHRTVVTATADTTQAPYGTPMVITARAGSLVGDAQEGTFHLLVDDEEAQSAPAMGGAVVLDGLVLPVGEHTIVVRHVDGDHQSDSDPLMITVTPAATSTGLTIGTDPVLVGEPATATVEVTGAGLAQGDVLEVTESDVVVGSATLSAEDLTEFGARVEVPVRTGDSGLPVGTHSLVAHYRGNANAQPSSSGTATLDVLVGTTLTGTVPEVPAGVVGTLEVTVTPIQQVTGQPVGGTLTVSAPGWTEPLTAQVSDGVATVELPARSAGDLELTLSYSGSGSYAPSSVGVTSRVRAAGALVTLEAPATSTYGDPLAATVTVTLDNGATATGSVDLHEADADGAPTGDALATAPLEEGAAEVALPRLGAGGHSLVAVYRPGGGDVSGATSPAVPVTMEPRTPEVSLTLESTTVTVGDTVGGVVSATALGATVPGTLAVTLDGQDATVTPVEGGWTFRVPTTSVGSHRVAVTLTPSSADLAPVTREVAVDVSIRDTQISATLESSAVSAGEQAEISLSLPGAAGAQVTVAWGDEQRVVTLDGGGAATVVLPALALGSHEVGVSFGGSATLAPSSRTLTLTVLPLGGSVWASGTSTRFGVDTPGVDVTFVGVPAGSPAPTGRVSVRSGQSVLGSAELSEGNAHVLLSVLGVGEHQVDIIYEGDARFAASSTTASVLVTTAPSALEVTWPLAQVFGQVNGGVAVNASVPDAGEDFGEVTGTVELLVDGAPAGSGQLAESRVSLALPAGLSAGAHTLVVRYTGTETIAAAEATGSLIVTDAATTVTVQAPSTSQWGQSVEVLVDVAPAAGGGAGAAAVGGAVSVTVGTGPMPVTAQLVDGHATVLLDSSVWALGEVPLTVTYLGGDGYAPSSVVHTLTLTAAPSSLTATTRVTTQPHGIVEISAEVGAGELAVTGTVSATSDTAPTLTAEVVDGRAVLLVPDTVEDGEHTYVLTYRSNGGVAESTSAPVTISVHRQDGAGPVSAEAELASVEVGADQVLHVSGLEPEEQVLLFLHSDPVYLGSATADAQGVVEFAFSVPGGTAPGEHRIEVRRASGIVSAWMSVTEAPDPGGDPDDPDEPGGGTDTPGGGTANPGDGSGGSGNGTGSGTQPGDITAGGGTGSGTATDRSGAHPSGAATGTGTGSRSELVATGAQPTLVLASLGSLALALWGAMLIGRSRSRMRVQDGKRS